MTAAFAFQDQVVLAKLVGEYFDDEVFATHRKILREWRVSRPSSTERLPVLYTARMLHGQEESGG